MDQGYKHILNRSRNKKKKPTINEQKISDTGEHMIQIKTLKTTLKW